RRRPALTSAETSAPMVSASVETGFRRSATAELLTGVAVLLITAILVATPTTMDAGAMPP
ncbi:MAG: hypothetical protein ABIW79_04440, partial [Gemmatimonas sp.]